MPGAPERPLGDDAIRERASVVSARGPHREHLTAGADDDDALSAGVTEQWRSILQLRECNPLREIGS
jgi:hypothetical protein